MNRSRCILPLVALILTLFAIGVAHAQEPNYTATLPDKQTFHLALQNTINTQNTVGDDGGRVVRVVNRPQGTIESSLYLDATLVADGKGQVSNCHIRFGKPTEDPNAPFLYQDLEAVRRDSGGYGVRTAGRQGVIPFVGRPISTFDAWMFLGRRYDFKKAGRQSFLYVADTGNMTVLIPLTVEAVGKETLTLTDGKVATRKLRCTLEKVPWLGEKPYSATVFVGPIGEILRADTPIFFIPFVAKGAAKVEKGEDGKVTRTLTLANPGGWEMKAERLVDGWNIPIGAGTGAFVTVDNELQLVRFVTQWTGGKNSITVQKQQGTITYNVEPGQAQETAVPTDRAWFLPQWFFTDLWEGKDGPFVLKVGESRDGTYFPIFTGERVGRAFTLTRLADLRIKGRTVDSETVVRRYRFGSKDPAYKGPTYDLYTDGARLIHFIGSDGLTITRDGWETWAKSTTPPPAPKVEGGKAP